MHVCSLCSIFELACCIVVRLSESFNNFFKYIIYYSYLMYSFFHLSYALVACCVHLLGNTTFKIIYGGKSNWYYVSLIIYVAFLVNYSFFYFHISYFMSYFFEDWFYFLFWVYSYFAHVFEFFLVFFDSQNILRVLCIWQGPVSGYLSVLRTLLSAFIASYELNQQVLFLPFFFSESIVTRYN